MSAVSFAGTDLPIRSDLIEAHERAWAAKQKVTRHRDGSVSLVFRSNASCPISVE